MTCDRLRPAGNFETSIELYNQALALDAEYGPHALSNCSFKQGDYSMISATSKTFVQDGRHHLNQTSLPRGCLPASGNASFCVGQSRTLLAKQSSSSHGSHGFHASQLQTGHSGGAPFAFQPRGASPTVPSSLQSVRGLQGCFKAKASPETDRM